MKKRFLVFAMVLLLSLSALAVTASADVSKEAIGFTDWTTTEGALITYKGLSARTLQDFAGLRSLYVVDENKVAEFEETGTVTYGVMAFEKTDATVLDNMTVNIVDDAIQKATGVNYIVVYDTNGRFDASNIYVEKDHVTETQKLSLIAYTVAFFYENQTSDLLRDTQLSFRAFYMLNDGTTQYIDMPTADDTNASFKVSASLYDVAKYLTTEHAKKDEYAALPALRNVIEQATKSFTVDATVYGTEVEGKKIFANAQTVTVEAPAAGLYMVSLQGSCYTGTTSGYYSVFGFHVKELNEVYSFKIGNASNSSQSAKDPADTDNKRYIYTFADYQQSFACALQKGENTLIIYNPSASSRPQAQVTGMKFERFENLTETDNTVFSLRSHEVLGSNNGVYAKLFCPSISGDTTPCNVTEDHTYHYYKTNGYGSKWATISNGAVQSLNEFVTSEENLPKNAIVRDCTYYYTYDGTSWSTELQKVPVSLGELKFQKKPTSSPTTASYYTTVTTNTVGQDVCTIKADTDGNGKEETYRGSQYMVSGMTLYMNVTLPKAGNYDIHLLYGTNVSNGKVSYRLYDASKSAPNFTNMSPTKLPNYLDGGGGAATAQYYDVLSTVTTTADDQTIQLAFEIGGTGSNFITFPRITFVRQEESHTVRFEYTDANDKTHVLSEQKIANNAYADVPTFLPAELAGYVLEDEAAAKAQITEDKTFKFVAPTPAS